MSRLDNAYQQMDKAVKELVAASAETAETWIVSHYLTVVGQQRYTDAGPVESVESLYLPFNGSLTYSLDGLAGKLPGLIESIDYADCTEE